MTAVTRRKVFQAQKFSDPVLEMDDQIAFLQFGEINVEGRTGGQRVPPSVFSGGCALPAPTYLLTKCASVTGT